MGRDRTRQRGRDGRVESNEGLALHPSPPRILLADPSSFPLVLLFLLVLLADLPSLLTPLLNREWLRQTFTTVLLSTNSNSRGTLSSKEPTVGCSLAISSSNSTDSSSSTVSRRVRYVDFLPLPRFVVD